MVDTTLLEFKLQEDATIPANVAVRCPATQPERFKMRRAANACPRCSAFIGVYEVFGVQHVRKWEDNHQICCTHPIARRCFDVEVLEE